MSKYIKFGIINIFIIKKLYFLVIRFIFFSIYSGKWTNSDCDKHNWVLCEKPQAITFEQLYSSLILLKHRLKKEEKKVAKLENDNSDKCGK